MTPSALGLEFGEGPFPPDPGRASSVNADGRFLAAIAVSMPIAAILLLIYNPGSAVAASVAVLILGLSFGAELDIIAHRYLVIYQNPEVQRYFEWLDSLYKERGIEARLFDTFRNVGAIVEKRRHRFLPT